MSTVKQVSLVLVALVLPACDGQSAVPADCDALQRCEGISVSVLLCQSRRDDPMCGNAFQGWLDCRARTCVPDARSDLDAGPDPCAAELTAWQTCRDAELAGAGHDR
jgi:hypothetical protein